MLILEEGLYFCTESENTKPVYPIQQVLLAGDDLSNTPQVPLVFEEMLRKTGLKDDRLPLHDQTKSERKNPLGGREEACPRPRVYSPSNILWRRTPNSRRFLLELSSSLTWRRLGLPPPADRSTLEESRMVILNRRRKN